jgi:NAD(P)-dependent dehydrogenase (short-subunit alcohol dehydrogenase family)
MNKKCVITGHTRGIGLSFYKHFAAKGWNVIGFNTTTGLDRVVAEAQGCDLFINNAYANGLQTSLFNQLHASVKKMIVCGSIAARYPDSKMPAYSHHKKELEDRVIDVANTRRAGQADILLLQLTSTSYADDSRVLKFIDFWLDNTGIINVGFDI